MNSDDRIFQYAKFYATTRNRTDFKKAIADHLGGEYVDEAVIAWTAIDYYDGSIRPELETGT